MAGLRRAVVIGINEYDDKRIEPLKGAIYDAAEIRDALVNQGNFVVDKGHFLIDKDATGEAIRKAISDLFWKTEQCDICLFFFSGHGRRDHYKQGYLLPRDVDYDQPFVHGIRIHELKELFLVSRPKDTCILMLDCCYGGIATQEKTASGSPEDIKSFYDVLGGADLSSDGSGRFIFAAADPDKTTHEEEHEHAFGGGKHAHGYFSFHLIEGLNGASRDEFGRVSLAKLALHLEGAFEKDNKELPPFSFPSGKGIDQIFLTTAADELEVRLQERLDEIENMLKAKTPRGLTVAISILDDLKRKGIESQEIFQLFKLVDEFIEAIGPIILDWWLTNGLIIFRETKDNPWYRLLNDTLNNFDLEVLRRLDTRSQAFVCHALECIVEDKSYKSIVEHIRILNRDSQAERRPIGAGVNTLSAGRSA